MEVVIPVQELHLNSKTRTAYMSSSSSPKRFTCDSSGFHRRHAAAPTSPATTVAGGGYCSLLATEEEDDDFAFDFSGHLDKNAPPPQLTTADELFYEGKIRALKFPVGLCSPDTTHRIGAKSSDPFSTSMAEPNRETRSRNRAPSLSSRSRKGSRSLSPLRNEIHLNNPSPTRCKTEEENTISSKKWSFKDLLLFRSASEGRATGDRNKDVLRKYTAACLASKGKKGSGGDESRSSSSRWASSPHAMHYAANRAAAEEMKKKTALPYKDSFLNWLRYAPALRSFGSTAGRGKSMGGSKSMPRIRDGN
ncbi:uncharacterized protein LOC110115651 [Dendrobium catenatum]|uniref:Uncharacterized protein n=1 Tax=Dendrobium catenatum TaxID=906689 RepID=A0A2I0XHB2_9ASPA|nr:uncharacterized protein LOC110115651 [Dendrobium catenatum]PKU87303.1 hypothetical protein MA16_Dca024336 [Dendrobium catenatum]